MLQKHYYNYLILVSLSLCFKVSLASTEVISKLPINVQAILEREKAISENGNGWKIVIEESHALYDVLLSRFKESHTITDPEYVASCLYFTTLARIYQEVRVLIAKRTWFGCIYRNYCK